MNYSHFNVTPDGLITTICIGINIMEHFEIEEDGCFQTAGSFDSCVSDLRWPTKYIFRTIIKTIGSVFTQEGTIHNTTDRWIFESWRLE